MELSARGLRMIQAHEGLSLEAYLCPAGVWTIGYGATRIDGRPVRSGMRITGLRAVELLAADAERFADAVRQLVDVPLNQNEFDALTSFAYNVGEGAFRDSTLRRKLNAGDRQGAADEFPRWVNGGGKRLPGLVRRREEERALFLEPVAPPKPTHWLDEVDARPEGGQS